MKPFVTQLFHLALSSLAVYAVLLGISMVLVPPQRGGTLDTAQAARSLFATEPKYVFLGRGALNSADDKVLLLGASNVVTGFRQDQLQQLVPGAEINNIGVGGSNVTQLRQIVDLVLDVQNPEVRRHNTFVIGAWYGLFAEDHRRWNMPDRHAGDTDIDIERYRYGFYRRTDSGPVSMIPRGLLGVGVALIHPILVADKLLRDATKSMRRVMAGNAPVPANAQRNAAAIGESDRRRYLAFWDDYMGRRGRLADEQFVVLERLIDRISGTGGRVVIADLPLPAWHQQRSPYYADYRERTRSLFDRFEMLSGVQVVRLRAGGADADFSDEVHPKPKVALGWSRQLAAVLNRHGGDGGRLLARRIRAAGADPRSAESVNP
jgi:hypothetical protein